MKAEEIRAIVDRERPGVAWCEGCGAITQPENASDAGQILWHTGTYQDPKDGSAIPVQCGPMHALAVVTADELTQIVERVAYLEAALGEIAQARGRFSKDQSQFAANVIESAQRIAVGAIAGTWTKEE